MDLSLRDLIFAYQGGHGNIEFLAYLVKERTSQMIDDQLIQSLVSSAHKEFKQHEKE